MPAYSVVGDDAGTVGDTGLYFVNGATRAKRLALSEVILSSADSPDDQQAEYRVKRIDDENGTPGGTAVTPQTLDEDDVAADSNAVESPTGEPTYETTTPTGLGPLMVALNQRVTWRWVAVPGRELRCAAAEDTGFGIYLAVNAGTAFPYTAVMIYEE